MPALTDMEAQRIIDEQILQHEQRISEIKASILALKTHRNTHSAISHLPTELMAQVFVHAKQNAQDQSSCDSFHWNMEWLKISVVCRQWRDVALKTPWLWSSIAMACDMQHPLDFLKRSKSLPLRIHCGLNYYDKVHSDPGIKAVMSQFERCHELTLHAETLTSVSQFLALNASGSAPALEVLGLTSSDPSPSALPLLSSLWHDMPSLRILKLDAIYLLSELPILPRLTSLDIQCRTQPLRLSDASPLSTVWLVRSLRNTPQIEDINISDLASDFDTEALLPLDSLRVSLPKLVSFRISTEHINTSKVFDYIDYPLSALIDFTCASSDQFRVTPPNFSSLQHVCSQLTHGDRAPLIDDMEVILYNSQFEVFVWSSETPEEGEPSLLSLSVPAPLFPFQSVVPYVQLWSALPLATVTTLILDGFRFQPVADWLNIFPLFQQLTTLCLSRCGADALDCLLATDQTQKPPMERLESITLRSCRILDCYTDGPEGGMRKAVVRVLNQRKELGMAIQGLHLEACDVTEDIACEFAYHVNVWWDGKVKMEYNPGIRL